MTPALDIAMGIVVLGAVLAAARAVRRGRLADRAVAFDTITSALTCGFLVAAALTQEDRFVDLALVLGLLSFLSSVTIARYMESRRR